MFKNKLQTTIEETSDTCAGEYLKDKFPELELCVEGDQGNEFLEEMGQQTHGELSEEELKGDMPVVKINGESNVEALTDLVKAVCDEIQVSLIV